MVCFCHELTKRGLQYQRQVNLPIVYDGMTFDEGLRVDVFVEDSIICELKAVDQVNPVWEAQILSQLKLTKKRLGFLINFNVPLIKKGIKRIILSILRVFPARPNARQTDKSVGLCRSGGAPLWLSSYILP